MRDYGKVQTEFWEHPGVRRLSTEGKLLYVYLLTGPHTNMSGCFKAPFGYVADDLGWVTETVSERFGELSREGFATYDPATRFVMVHGFLKFNKIDNRNVAVPLINWFNDVPEASPLKALLAAEIVEFVDKLDAAQRAAVERFLKPLPERSLNPESREQGAESRENPSNTCSEISSSEPEPTQARDALEAVSPPPVSQAKKRKADPTPAEVEEFIAFWSVYPLRKAKPRALDAFVSARRKGVALDVILTGAAAYAGERAGKDGKYTCHPATWLNEARWDDEPTPTAANDGVRGQGMRGYSALDQAVEGIGWDIEGEVAA